MVLFFIPFGVFIEAMGNSSWLVFAGETPGLVFGQQAFAFVAGTCLGNFTNKYFAMNLKNTSNSVFSILFVN
jgi:hypothetical protein